MLQVAAGILLAILIIVMLPLLLDIFGYLFIAAIVISVIGLVVVTIHEPLTIAVLVICGGVGVLLTANHYAGKKLGTRYTPLTEKENQDAWFSNEK